MKIRKGVGLSVDAKHMPPPAWQQVPRTSMRVQFVMDDREFELNLQALLLKNVTARKIPDAEIDRILQDIVIFRITLTRAVEELRSQLEATEDQFRHWKANRLDYAYGQIIKGYEEKTGKSVSMSKMTGISRQQAEDWLWGHPKFYKAMARRRADIRAIRKRLGIIEGVIDSISSWQIGLQSIAKRREKLRAEAGLG